MNIGSMAISGLVARDIDISGVITQLAQIKRRPVELLEQKQSTHSRRLTAFQQLTARCLALGTATAGLTDGTAFEQVTARSGDPGTIAVSASAGAPVGSYRLEVARLAQSQKVSSGAVASTTEALGHSGEFLLNGRVVAVEAGFTLRDIRDAINAAGAGVSASILTGSETEHYLRLTSLSSGLQGAMQMVDVSGVLEALGVQDGAVSTKHALADGMASDALAERFTPVGEALGLGAAPAGVISVNGVHVSIDLSADSLEEIAASIGAVEGVGATVEEVEAGGVTRYQLRITGESGAPALVDDGNVLLALGVLERGLAHEVDAAQDALFTIDGVAMSRPTNAVDDAIDNVQLQLLRETDGAPVTVSIAADTAATVEAVQRFVDAYNAVIRFISEHQSFDTDAGTGGLFLGSPAVLQLETQLREQISRLVNTLGGELTLGSQAGLRFNTGDEIVFDSLALLDRLQSDPEGLRRLFGTRTATSGEVEVFDYSSATADSGPGGWAVEITQAATRPTAIGATLAAGIAMDETLTVNGVSVSLTAGMSAEEAADALNAALIGERMEITAAVEGDRLVLRHELWGSRHSIAISSSLDEGSGGTDLGGSVAGEARVYEGQDVVGTIRGEAATGTGRLLTGGRGTPAEGLRLVIAATEAGPVGEVRVSRGIAARMSALIERATDSRTGALTRAAEGQSGEIAAIDEQIAAVEADVDRYIERLQVDFALMESKMSRSLALLDWMENQIEYLPGAQRRR
ncbi:MAG: flagellar filament capping protein FliD [Armatimonadota bacterium]|jgi:flagellar hook-associated protein 2